MKILNRWTGEEIISVEGDSLVNADLHGADLRNADLHGADLRGANLYGADLRGAYLISVNLRNANLRNANLRNANLTGADLYGANLTGAYLIGANLTGAYLTGANLTDANLTNVTMNWQSHELIARRLFVAATDNPGKRKVAGLILISVDWCWDKFISLRDPLAAWVIEEMSTWVKDGDNAPSILERAVKRADKAE